MKGSTESFDPRFAIAFHVTVTTFRPITPIQRKLRSHIRNMARFLTGLKALIPSWRCESNSPVISRDKCIQHTNARHTIGAKCKRSKHMKQGLLTTWVHLMVFSPQGFVIHLQLWCWGSNPEPALTRKERGKSGKGSCLYERSGVNIDMWNMVVGREDSKGTDTTMHLEMHVWLWNVEL